MIDKNYIIPLVYQKMNERGFTNPQNDSYLWLNEMEWMPIDKIEEYEYDEGKTKPIVIFAITCAGDKWVWGVSDKGEEYSVGLCERAESNGIYYAKNTEDAILRQIIEYVASSNFYLIKDEAESYQINEKELKIQFILQKNALNLVSQAQYGRISKKRLMFKAALESELFLKILFSSEK